MLRETREGSIMADTKRPDDNAIEYEPPQVEELSTEAGPSVTAAGDSPVDDV
jgi:hypothetical protein